MNSDPYFENIDILLELDAVYKKIDELENASGYKINDLINLFKEKKLIIDGAQSYDN